MSFLAQPLDHLLQLASVRRPVDIAGQGGRRAHRGLASARTGGDRGKERRWCVLPDGLRAGGLTPGLGMPQGGISVEVEQLGAGLG
eukprot:scaffold43183_cov59-Phaeocystis_antarctica.AAC.2